MTRFSKLIGDIAVALFAAFPVVGLIILALWLASLIVDNT